MLKVNLGERVLPYNKIVCYCRVWVVVECFVFVIARRVVNNPGTIRYKVGQNTLEAKPSGSLYTGTKERVKDRNRSLRYPYHLWRYIEETASLRSIRFVHLSCLLESICGCVEVVLMLPAARFCEVVRSDRYAYGENGKNCTLECLQRHFVSSMNACGQMNDPSLHGYTMHLCISKGDWKHKREWLQQERHYSNQTGLICPRCLCDTHRKPWADLSERFNNDEDLEEAATTSVLTSS